MAFDDKNQKNQGNQGGMNKDQQNKGGFERTNPDKPTGTTPSPGQSKGKAGMDNEQELDEQAKATGQMPSQKESNRMTGTSSGGTSGNRGSTGSSGGSNR